MIKTFRSISLVISLLLILLFFSVAHANFANNPKSVSAYKFAIPLGLESEVNFWKKIYSEYTTRHAVIHDMRNLAIVYEVVYLGKKPMSRRTKERKLERKKEKYKKILRRIAKTKDKSLLMERGRAHV